MPRAADAQCGLWDGHQPPSMPGEYKLLIEILRGAPRLPNGATALCRMHPVHLSADPVDIELARELCACCPMLSRCREYVEGLSRAGRRSLSGVWAGEYYGNPDN